MTVVHHDPAARLWMLTTPHSSYVVRLDDRDRLRHLHWGARLTPEQAAALPHVLDVATNFDGELAEEYPGEGGARFGVPALRVVHPDGSRSTEWQPAGHRVEDGLLVLSFRERLGPLELDLCYRVHPDSDAVDRWTELRHTGADGPPVRIGQLAAARWTLPLRADYRLGHVTGGWSAENRLAREPLARAETVLTSRRGITGHQANPWVALDAGDADEEHGEVWTSALAWSGSWRITVERTVHGLVAATHAAGHEGPEVVLRPGESWRTPVSTGLYAADGFGGASRAWHAHVRAHVLPRPEELRPVLYNSWEATGFDVDLAGQLDLARRAAALGVELFVTDDGWFGARKDDTAGLGDWTPAPDRFPDGLAPLAAEVRRLGMRFGLWVEPEMVNPDSDLYRAHPDWVLHEEGRPRTELRNQLVLDFGRPEVAAWAHGWLDGLVREHGVDHLKWDMNRVLTEAGRPGDPDADRLWHGHVRAVHALMDRLRADHPGLRIEACSGGGGRTDLAMLARTDQVWASDNTDALDRIAIQHGYGQLYPPGTMGAWVTDSPNPLTGRRLPLEFRFHVAMTGALGIGGDLTHWSEDELARAAELVARYKRIRPVVQHGRLHRLRDAVQYVHGDEVVLVAWRLAETHGTPVVPLRMVGLDPDARYVDQDTGEVHHGAVLTARGLTTGLTRDHSSRLLHLRRQD
ncbi:alpha-galactosidase [Kitasatospora sp. SolWspMP-SS2h]|uniref:alpha-galactosidase n=1 Tax=Kitasatospora sp. SolWspMP-SS2h TaxID=1305729 RepID=UPI000DBA1307|nr:alpha-galactosidase [Kitasatospora sp. SolWspMP-SS2h]RAJ36805.1 alpha-galactosidase [Kitasatospora sp. SolWspMP-SS2h]